MVTSCRLYEHGDYYRPILVMEVLYRDRFECFCYTHQRKNTEGIDECDWSGRIETKVKVKAPLFSLHCQVISFDISSLLAR